MREVFDVMFKIIIGFIGLFILIATPISYLIIFMALIVGSYSVGYGILEFIKDVKK